MKEQLRNSVRKAYNKLTDDQKQSLSLISILCTHIDGVSLSDLCTIIGTEPRVFEKEVIALAKADLLAIQVNTVFPPTEGVASFFDVSVDRLNICIKRLCQKTTLSIGDDLLQVRPYFLMAMSTMKYLAHSSYDDDIDYEEYGTLLVNITRHYEIFAEPDRSIHDVHDLPLWRRLNLIKSKINNKSMLYAALCTSQANGYLNGFWYDESKQLLDEALTIAHEDNETLVSVYFTKALWHENYGQIGDCLAWAYRSWEVEVDEAFKDKCAMYIAYQLSLLEEFDTCQKWINKIDLKAYPKFHEIRIYYSLIQAMMNKNNESVCEQYLKDAEWCINMINTNAPLKGRIYYVKSQIYDNWGLTREANNYYRLYSVLMVDQYKATDGGTYIYIAAEVTRLTNLGAISSAKIMVNDILDGLQLSHAGYSPAVKLCACWSYMNYYRTTGQFALAEKYYKLGKELIEKYMIPLNETVAIVRDFFEDDKIPACISGDNYVWLLEHQHLINLLSNKNVSRTDVQKEVENIKQRFPDHELELDVINAATMHTYDALHLWNQNISKASKNERYNIALLCARFAASQGLLWDANQFYITAQYTEGYGCLNRYQKITFLLEMLNNMEECGLSGQSLEYWIDLEEMSEGTALYSEVLQARGNALYARSKYHEALKYLDRALEEYQPEKTVFDERLVSILAYRCCCLCAIGNYKEAHTAALHAKQNSRDDSFDIEFNLAYSSLAIGKVKDARIILDNAKTLAESDADRTSIADLTSILRLNKKERAEYFKKSLKKNTLL